MEEGRLPAIISSNAQSHKVAAYVTAKYVKVREIEIWGRNIPKTCIKTAQSTPKGPLCSISAYNSLHRLSS